MTYRLKITKVKGKEYAAIVENIYDKRLRGSTSRTVRSYGNLIQLRQDNPNIDDELRQEVRRLNAESACKSASNSQSQYSRDFHFNASASLKTANTGIAFYRKIWDLLELPSLFNQTQSAKQTNIQFDFDLAVFLLAAERILKPQSMLETFKERDELIFDFSKLTLKNIYECVDVLPMMKHTITSHLTEISKKIIPETTRIALFDRADIVFSSVYKNAAQKSDCTPVDQPALCMLVDENGIPKDYELLNLRPEKIDSIYFLLKNSELINQHKVSTFAVHGSLCGQWIENKGIGKGRGKERSIIQISDIGSRDAFFPNCNSVDGVKYKTLQSEQSSEFTHQNFAFWSSEQQLLGLKIQYLKLQKRQQLAKKSFQKTINSAPALFDDNLYKQNVEHADLCIISGSKTLHEAFEIYEKFVRLQFMRVPMAKAECSTIDLQEKLIAANLLITFLALVMQSLGNHLVQRANIKLSDEQIVDLLRKESALIVQEKGTQRAFYIRQGISANIEKNRMHAKLIDDLLSVVGIKPICAIEEGFELMQKLNLCTNIKISA